MKYEEFLEKVKENIKEYLPVEYAESIPEISGQRQNNGRISYGICLFRPDRTTAPFLHLEGYYEKYIQGVPFDNMMRGIAASYYKRDIESPGITMEDFMYQNIKEKIFVEVCNAEMNREELETIPHEIMEDLAAKFYIQFKCEDTQVLKMTVRNSYLQLWDISKEELKEQAWKNMHTQFKPLIAPLDRYAIDYLECDFGEDISVPGIYVLTSSTGALGAVYMLDESTMDYIAKKLNDDVLIMPSSVNEVLFLKKSLMNDSWDLQYLKQMVEEVNATMVDPEEVLSGEVYMYEKDTHTLSKIDVYEQEQGMNMTM